MLDVSTATHRMLVVPSGYVLVLLDRLHAALATATVSVAVPANTDGSAQWDVPNDDDGWVEMPCVPGQVMVGGCASSTVTMHEHEQASAATWVAVHVTVALPDGNGVPGMGWHPPTATPTGSYASAVNCGMDPDMPYASASDCGCRHVMEGHWLSTTVTVNTHHACLPETSVDMQLTTLRPTLNRVVPSAGLHRTVGVPDTAIETGVNHVNTPVVRPGDRHVVALLGQYIAGGILNAAATVHRQGCDTSPPKFTATHDSCINPSGKLDPDGVEHVMPVTSPASVAVGVWMTCAVTCPAVGATSTLAGHVMFGAVVCVTCTAMLQFGDVLPASSVAKHCTPVVVPRANGLPNGGEHVMERTRLLSVAFGV